jgi:nucleoside-diphosphate-sugar epimerase
MSEYTRINVEGTKSIIEGCLAAKVGRFLYLSSIKVNGEKTVDLPFRCDDVPRPIGGYAISKKLAEDALMKTCAAGRIDWVIIRPPLVYGSGVKANFSRLINFAQSGWFVPLGACQNHRSIVYVGNLCSLISRSLVDKRACGQTLLVSDGRDLTVAELIREISKASCKPTRLVYVPRFLLSVAGTILGMKNQIDRLTQPLEVDISETTALLNWHPPFDVEEAIRLTVHG